MLNSKLDNKTIENILSPKCAKEQINKLISDGIAEVLDKSKLDDIEKLIITILCSISNKSPLSPLFTFV